MQHQTFNITLLILLITVTSCPVWCQIEADLRNDYFAFYENGNFNNSYIQLSANGNRGALFFYNANFNRVGWFDANSEDAGYMGIMGDAGTRLISLNSITASPTNGSLSIFGGATERRLAQLFASGDNSGGLVTWGPTSENTVTSYLSGFSDHGYVGVKDAMDTLEASMYVDAQGNGVLTADVKNFVSPHPLDPELEIVYASLEGPEAAAYARGTGTLRNGKAIIDLPDHFLMIGDLNDMTVQLTPQSVDTYGLAIIEKGSSSFTVQELKNGTGNFSFDWEVKTIRKKFRDYRVVRKKSERAPSISSFKMIPAKAREVLQTPERKE